MVRTGDLPDKFSSCAAVSHSVSVQLPEKQQQVYDYRPYLDGKNDFFLSKDANKHILSFLSITRNYAGVLLCKQEAGCFHDLQWDFPHYKDSCSSAHGLALLLK